MTTTMEKTKNKPKTESTSVPVKRAEPDRGELVHGWNPLRLFEDLRDEMEGFWRGARLPHFPKLAAPETNVFLPSTDVFRSNGNLVVKADLPGLRKDDVEVMVEDGCLVVQGERKEEKEKKGKEYYRSECSYGSFYRRVPLPEEVDPAKITAKVRDGVLEVTVPLPASETKKEAKKIQVA